MKKFDKDKFATRLREVRNGLPMVELAKIIGTNHGSISRWESGENIPSIEHLFNLAQHFNVSADYLIGIVDFT